MPRMARMTALAMTFSKMDRPRGSGWVGTGIVGKNLSGILGGARSGQYQKFFKERHHQSGI
ncbi:MAG: hypothetical protein GWN89_08095 [Thermoplasmata archaeon]|nr:hypothetical protein [Thermoplasmata archaeon]NIT77084.1 hypothetical protein [Thermoplasmata archaeon]NIU48996.1 hypothetical protein [Thermoplasmata archaeon]NIY03455.1 hypothetical protein [Thermoplasmata archaeon]